MTQPKPTPAPYVYVEFPRMLYREGAPRPHMVKDAEEEARMTAAGWGRTPVEPPKPVVPQTDTEIALEARERAHRAAMATLKDNYGSAIGVLKTELALMKGQYAALEAANAELRLRLMTDAGDPAKGKNK